MAQKKITDLELISSFTDACNFAIDNSVQTYRGTALQLITYILSKYPGGTYGAKSADYTILDTDNYRVIGMTTSNTNRTVTLPAAANNTNRIITVVKVDTGTGTLTLSGTGYTTAVAYKMSHAITCISTGSAWVDISLPFISSRTDLDTINGVKTYAHGTTYNGGNAPTITLASGGGTLTSIPHSAFLPYLVDGTQWRLKGHFSAEVSATARTAATFNIAGVTSPNINALMSQPVNFRANATATPLTIIQGGIDNNTAAFVCTHASASSTYYWAQFDILLAAKPNWAY